MNRLAIPQPKESRHPSVTVEPRPAPKPTLAAIAEAICADARKDALKYALRSDTGHDGE